MALATADRLVPLHIAAGRRVANVVTVLTSPVNGSVKYRITREQAIDGLRARKFGALGRNKPVIFAVVEMTGPEAPHLATAENKKRDRNTARYEALPKFTTERDDWDNPRGT